MTKQNEMPQGMPMPVPIQANPTMDFITETLVTLLHWILKSEDREKLIRHVVERMTQVAEHNIGELKKHPQLLSASLDGSLDDMKSSIIQHVQELGNVFNGKVIYEQQSDVNEKAEELKSSLILAD